LLYVGTDETVLCSVDGGAHWFQMDQGLPHVPVHDLVLHPREPDLVIGTHGRGFYILDIQSLREYSTKLFQKPIHLFKPTKVTLRSRAGTQADGFSGQGSWMADNPDTEALLEFWIKNKPADVPVLRILDAAGKELRSIEGKLEAGVQRVAWNLWGDSPERPISGRRSARPGPSIGAGTYKVVLEVGEWFRHETELVIAREE
jgi:hypothetical protein